MIQRLLSTFLALALVIYAGTAQALFLQPDTLDPTQPGVGTNRYAYSMGDPINNADPSGQFCVPCGLAIVGAATAAIDYLDDGQMNGFNPAFDALTSGGNDNDAGGPSVAMSPSGNDGPGMGHNGGPSLDDDQEDPGDSNGQGPNPFVEMLAVAATISTADVGGGQSATPRSFAEELVFETVQANPTIGQQLGGLNNDPRFSPSDGWQKMQYVHRTLSGDRITVHYQFNNRASVGQQVYDLKVVNNSLIGSGAVQ